MTPTIAAIATPPGRGGVGVIRLSGPDVPELVITLLGKTPVPRSAHYLSFKNASGEILDQGLLLYFPKPHSFTGEDVLELHTHGSPIVLDQVLQYLLTLGVVMAKPGEFSERAFLNGKMDLTQAEAIADLINASSTQAARSAVHSLQGFFSKHIQTLLDSLTNLRVYVEANLDFSDEDINLLANDSILEKLKQLQHQVHEVQLSAQQGVLLRDGAHVVIAGEPNVGKSSLLNRLSGQERAIVTDIPGTTRDILREPIHLDGLPLHLIDTAGLRTTADQVEQEGIKRAEQAIREADHILWMVDSLLPRGEGARRTDEGSMKLLLSPKWANKPLTCIINKIDLHKEEPKLIQHPDGFWEVYISAKTGAGIDLLVKHLKDCLGFRNVSESTFTARRRHLEALKRTQVYLQQAEANLNNTRHPELFAEELRLAQLALSEITGAFLPDDLLGKIFSEFCIGK